MAQQSRRDAAMLISVHVDPQGSPPWYARLTHFRDALSAETHSESVTTKEDVCSSLRDWLEAVIGPGEETPTG